MRNSYLTKFNSCLRECSIIVIFAKKQHVNIYSMKIRFLQLLAALIFAIPGQAESQNYNRISLNADFMFDEICSVGLSYHYMVGGYVGIGGTLGMWGEYGARMPYYDDELMEYYEGHGIYRLYLQPSVLITSPKLVDFGNGFGLNIEAQAGVMFNTAFTYDCTYYEDGYDPETFEYRSKWISFNGKAGFAVRKDDFVVGIGYAVSTIDVKRKINGVGANGYPNYEKQPLHGLYILGAICF